MGFTDDAMTGLAVLIDAAGVAKWRAVGAYVEPEVGIVINSVPQSPKSVLCLIPYPLADDPTLSESVLGVQVRARSADSNPAGATDLLDGVFDLLQGMWAVPLDGGIYLVSAERVSGTPLGEDANARAEFVDSYQLTLNRPSQHRT